MLRKLYMEKTKNPLINLFKNMGVLFINIVSDGEIDNDVELTGELKKDPVASFKLSQQGLSSDKTSKSRKKSTAKSGANRTDKSKANQVKPSNTPQVTPKTTTHKQKNKVHESKEPEL